MKKGVFFGKELKLSEKIYKNLLDRFDYCKFKYDKDHRCYNNYIKCELCEKYFNTSDYKCIKCPLSIFEDNLRCEGSFLCTTIIDKITKRKNYEAMSPGFNSISYFGKVGRNQIIKIHNFLLENFK